MRRQTIPDENESSAMPISLFHILQYAEDRFRIDATVLHPGQISSALEVRVPSDHAKKREMFPTSGGDRDGRHSFFAPCGANRRFVGYSGLVEKAKCGLVFDTPFLTAGQVVLIHVAIALSSRSRALLSGLWQENPKRSSVCQTDRSLYEIFVSFLM